MESDLSMSSLSLIEDQNDLPLRLWQKIFLYLQDTPEFPLLPTVSKRWARAFKEPEMQALRYIKQYGEHLVFFQLYKRHRSQLSFELVESLLKRNCPLPKYLIEMAYGTKLSNHLPGGTLERWLAYGYKNYGDKLTIGGITNAAFHNDANVFISAMEEPEEYMERLKAVVIDHHYSPSFNPLQNPAEWDRVYRGIANITLLDPSFGALLLKTIGQPFQKSNEIILTHIIMSPGLTPTLLKSIVESGFEFTDTMLVNFMVGMDPLDQDFPDISLVRAIFDQDKLKQCSIKALYNLFKENTGYAIRTCDHLMTVFEMDEEAVSIALTPLESDVEAMRELRGYHLPCATTFGIFNGGMSDAFWPLLSTRFGVQHKFMELCFIDLIVGGTISHRMQTEGDQHSSMSSLIGDYFGKGIPHLEAETEAATRQSMTAMMELGIPLGPQSFQVVAKLVYETRRAAPRFLDYMRRLEKTILAGDADARRNWIELFNVQVLAQKQWMTILAPDDQATPSSSAVSSEPGSPKAKDNRSSFAQLLKSVTETVRSMDIMEGRWREVRKFYSRLQVLVHRLEASLQGDVVPSVVQEQNQPTGPKLSITTSDGQGPFAQWLDQLEMGSAHPDLTPVTATATKKRSTWGINTWFQ
ncbi:hypothetical protein EDD86DRAFT_199722 [Gorgonomyces haynaldii]|nr:hypothetical protein EDD86DRAFT_199722 [Gorgonomyces haynaldii]